MGYIELTKDFWKEHERRAFSPTASLLYLRLLEECNRRRWRNPFTLSSVSLEETVNRSRKMLCQAREELRERGLIDFVAGNRMPTTFMLLKAPEKVPEKEALSEGGNEEKSFQKVSKMFPKCFRNVSGRNINEKNASQEGENGSQGGENEQKCFQNVSQGNINTSFINKDNKDNNIIGGESARYALAHTCKPAHFPPPLSADEIVENFEKENSISLQGFLASRGIGIEIFRELAVEVVGLWAARGWTPGFIRKGPGEYEAPKFFNWINTQLRIRREEEKNRAAAPAKSRDQLRREMLDFGAESIRKAAAGSDAPAFNPPY